MIIIAIFGAALIGFLGGFAFTIFALIKVSSTVDKGCAECPYSGENGKQCAIIQRLQEFRDDAGNNPGIPGLSAVPGATVI